jgi:flagellar motor switch protein FliN/FliY
MSETARQGDGGEGSMGNARDLLMEVELDATLQFGARELQLKEILALSLGDVLELDRQVNEPVDLVVGDRIVARGEVVIVEGKFALLVTEVATPQLRLESIRGCCSRSRTG